MKRRRFFQASAAVGASYALGTTSMSARAMNTSICPSANFASEPNLTKFVVEFILNAKYSDLPQDLIALGKKSILDGLGLALAGSKSKNATLFAAYMGSFGFAKSGAEVLGGSGMLPPRFAAFANGLAIHVEDFDDTQLAVGIDRQYGLLMHPTVPVLPAALAAVATEAVSGKDLMLAYHVGVEVECKICEAISPRHYGDGFHSTGTCGVFGSAAAYGKLRQLDRVHFERSFGIAAAQASGLRENFGTMTKSFHAGHAAEAGVVSTDLAVLGWTAAEQILEAERGFFHAYGGSYDPKMIHGLGHPWTMVSPGVSIKPYPCGSLTHPGMTELQRLIGKEKIKAGDVRQVEVGTNRNLPNALIHHQPKTGLEAKFSMEFCMAILLLDGKAGLGEFTDAVVNRPDVQELIEKVKFYVDPEAERAGYDKMATILKIHLRDGRTIIGRADFGKGSPENPMTYLEVAEKFLGCAEFAGWPTGKATEIVRMVRDLEVLPDVRSLIALCIS